MKRVTLGEPKKTPGQQWSGSFLNRLGIQLLRPPYKTYQQAPAKPFLLLFTFYGFHYPFATVELSMREAVTLSTLVTPPLYVPDRTTVLKLLNRFKKEKAHLGPSWWMNTVPLKVW
jgi:hypothetical protein